MKRTVGQKKISFKKETLRELNPRFLMDVVGEAACASGTTDGSNDCCNPCCETITCIKPPKI